MNSSSGKCRRRTIDDKIALAQQKLLRRKKSYENAMNTVNELLSKRDEVRKQELWKAIEASEHSYEEIMNFIRG